MEFIGKLLLLSLVVMSFSLTAQERREANGWEAINEVDDMETGDFGRSGRRKCSVAGLSAYVDSRGEEIQHYRFAITNKKLKIRNSFLIKSNDYYTIRETEENDNRYIVRIQKGLRWVKLIQDYDTDAFTVQIFNGLKKSKCVFYDNKMMKRFKKKN